MPCRRPRRLGTQVAEAGVVQTEDGNQDLKAWRELRIAPILTGGTSLAIWIGGVTAELYRLINCHDDPRPADEPYRSLLELTQTRAIIDVVTGTSAGGLNGVLLSTAWTLGAPTGAVIGLRDVWMELGSIDALLRSPNEKNPSSLLRGDEYFWPELVSVLDSLARQAADRGRKVHDPASQSVRLTREVDLALTVTTMTGELTHRTDDIGQVLQETHLNHTLRFRTADFGNDPEWSRRLALAARTSASIPGVFEASYLPVHEKLKGRPAFGHRASFSVGRWAVDGGVLANKPIGVARDRIVQRSAGSELRRVALFVNPTPSEAEPSPADDADDPPTLVEVATSALSAPHNIGIRHEIDDLREHNDRVRRSVDVGRALSRLLTIASPPSPGLTPTDSPSRTGSPPPVAVDSTAESNGTDPIAAAAVALYPQFRRDRAVLSVASMLDRVAPDLGEPGFPRRRVEDALVAAARSTSDWLPTELEQPIPVGPEWCWGIAPIEYGGGMLLELIRRVYQLPLAHVGPEHRRDLGEIRSAIHGTLHQVAEARHTDSNFWSAALQRRPLHLAQWADRCYQVWPDPRLVPDPRQDAGDLDDVESPVNQSRQGLTAHLYSLALDLAQQAQQLSRLIATIVLPGPDDSAPEEVIDTAVAVKDLSALLRLPTDELDELVRRMVAVHIVAVALGDTVRRHALIELVEVSWRADNYIDPSRRPEDKLAGVEFGRLGAFVKRSWRANDWMWGRMDGAAQLVRLLLDPHRLRQIGVTPDEVLVALDRADPDSVTEAEEKALRRELGFLVPETSHLTSVPNFLPVTTAAFAARVQRQIAREELPEVYFAALRSREEGAGEGDGGSFRRAYESATAVTTVDQVPASEVENLVRRCRVGTESAAGEVGEDLLTRTAGRAALVAANMVTGENSGLRWPSRMLRPFRQVALLGYVLTRAATTTSRTGMAVTATLSALAGSIVALFLLSGRTGIEINSGLVLLGAAILLLGLFLAIIRSGVIAALPALLALMVVALALIGPGIADVITGSTEFDPDRAWRHTLFLDPWPIVTFVVLIGVLGWVASALSRLLDARRLHAIDLRHARARGDQPPRTPRPPLIEMAAAVVLVPVILWFHQSWIEWFFVGEDTGWRGAIIDLATWLADRSVVMVITGTVVFGVFFGLAWDRSFGRVLSAAGHRFRR